MLSARLHVDAIFVLHSFDYFDACYSGSMQTSKTVDFKRQPNKQKTEFIRHMASSSFYLAPSPKLLKSNISEVEHIFEDSFQRDV